MNLIFIDREFKRLETLEENLDYEYEPKCKFKGGKRNIYYLDLKNDFVDEVSTYGFSPFILEKFEQQRKNPNIMRYMNKKFNHGLTNYVKRQNEVIPKQAITPLKREKKKIKIKPKEEIAEEENIYLKRKNVEKKTKKEIFLQKALKNLANNKLNLSSDEDRMFDVDKDEIGKTTAQGVEKTEDIQKKIVEATKAKLLNQLKEKYYKSIKETLPAVSISQFEKPDALKISFEKNFKVKNKINEGSNKKIVALSKNKDYLLTSKNNILAGLMTKDVENENEKLQNSLPNTNPNNKNIKKNNKTKRVKFRSKFYSSTFTYPFFSSRHTTLATTQPSQPNKDQFKLFTRAKKFKNS